MDGEVDGAQATGEEQQGVQGGEAAGVEQSGQAEEVGGAEGAAPVGCWYVARALTSGASTGR